MELKVTYRGRELMLRCYVDKDIETRREEVTIEEARVVHPKDDILALIGTQAAEELERIAFEEIIKQREQARLDAYLASKEE